VEKKRADTGKKERRCNVKPGQSRDEHRCAEHGEHML